jgi:signal peptidase
MRHLASLLRTAVVTLAVLAVAAIVAVMLGPIAAGYERYVITSGSMTGTYDTGSIVYAKAVPTAGLKVGDVITYAPPAGASPTELVTHRIAAITRGPQGQRVFRTKGDANPAPDPWRFELPAERQARVAFAVPYAGYVFLALAQRNLRMLLIGGPAVLVALSVLLGMIREARAGSRTERDGSSAPAVAAPPTVAEGVRR